MEIIICNCNQIVKRERMGRCKNNSGGSEAVLSNSHCWYIGPMVGNLTISQSINKKKYPKKGYFLQEELNTMWRCIKNSNRNKEVINIQYLQYNFRFKMIQTMLNISCGNLWSIVFHMGGGGLEVCQRLSFILTVWEWREVQYIGCTKIGKFGARYPKVCNNQCQN